MSSRKTKTVGDIISKYLEKKGFDGLYYDDCGCRAGDLFPCGEDCSECMPGHLSYCGNGEECDYDDGPCYGHIGPKGDE